MSFPNFPSKARIVFYSTILNKDFISTFDKKNLFTFIIPVKLVNHGGMKRFQFHNARRGVNTK